MAYGNWILNNRNSDCSVKHIGPLSYTEDDILIYTLYVSPPLKKTDEKRLKEHFEKFGEVENVNIVTRKNHTTSNQRNRSFSFAFVTFKEAESASKALKCRVHIFANRNLTIRSADSWKQPHQKKLSDITDQSTENADESENNEDISCSILNLNDDCLFLIFRYLNFNEQVRLSSLCTRLEYILELLYKTTKTLNIDLSESLTLMDFREGLQKIGPYIENITFNSGFTMKNFTRFIDFVSQFCPNLCKLKLDSLHFKYNEIFHKISTKLQTIRHLELKNCTINDDMTKFLSQIPTIEYLDLTENYEVTGIYLYQFPKLKTLILNSCANIQSSFFVKMCSVVKNIKELNIRRCDRLNTLAFQALVDNLNELETLTICTCYQTNELEKLTKLKNLRNLTIDQSSSRIERFLIKLAEDKKEEMNILKLINYCHSEAAGNAITEFSNLKQLDIPFASFCTETFIQNISKLKSLKTLNIPGSIGTNDSVLNLIKKSSHLDFIDLSCRSDYDNEFVKKIISILKNQSRSEPLTIRIGLTYVSGDIKEQSFIKEAKNILRIDTNHTEYKNVEIIDISLGSMSDDDLDDDDDDDIYFGEDDDDLWGSDYEYDSDNYMNAFDELDDDLLALFFNILRAS